MLVIALGCLAALNSSVIGQDGQRPAAGGDQAAVDQEEQIRELLLENPPVPLTKPRGYVRKAAKPYMPADGSLVVNRRCRITYRPDTGWYLLTFLAEPSDKPGGKTVPRWVLPSKWLSAVARVLAGKKSARFIVHGENTVYKDRAFILLSSVKIDRSVPGKTKQPKAPSPSIEVRKPEPATRPIVVPAAAKLETHASDIAARLLKSRPGRPVQVAKDSGPVKIMPSVAPGVGVEGLDEDRGDVRIDRTVVICPDGDSQWWQARFESDNTLQDQPVRLLPCRKLQEAEQLIASGPSQAVRLRITGVLSQYKQRQYLLLRKVIKEREMGQF